MAPVLLLLVRYRAGRVPHPRGMCVYLSIHAACILTEGVFYSLADTISTPRMYALFYIYFSAVDWLVSWR